MRHAFKVFYDGRGFSGSQRQKDERTVEGEFLSALDNLNVDYTNFMAAGRTDRGVSALGNVFSITSGFSRLEPRFINSSLPENIRVLSCKVVDEDFNPRHAKKRIYKYFLLDGGFNLPKMKDAVRLMTGEKSFHNYSVTDGRSPLRRIESLEINRSGKVLIFKVVGHSFLWQMVRRIVTMLKWIGSGRFGVDELEETFDPDFKISIPPSSPEYLVLWDVEFDFRFELEDYSKKSLENKLLRRLENNILEGKILEETLGLLG